MSLRSLLITLFIYLLHPASAQAYSQGEWQPENVVASKECLRCHENEEKVWKKTKHYATYDKFHKTKRAKEIAREYGIKTSKIRKPDSVCASCHYTVGMKKNKPKVVQGVSCQSCHGPGKDWVAVHNEFGDGLNIKQESKTHKALRIKAVKKGGMVVPGDLLGLAENCYQCHLITDEKLINTTSHPTASHFSFLERTQGNILHSRLADAQKKNQLIIAGAIAEVIGALDALGAAKQTGGRYARLMQETANMAVNSLKEAANATNDSQLKRIYQQVSSASLEPSNPKLSQLASSIHKLATDVMGPEGSLKNAKISKPTTPPRNMTSKPKEQKTPPSQAVTKPKTIKKPVEKSLPAIVKTAKLTSVISQKPKEPAHQTNPQAVPLFNPAAGHSQRIKAFELISPMSNSLCHSQNPWSKGWLIHSNNPVAVSCFGMAINTRSGDSVSVLLVNNNKQFIALTPGQCGLSNQAAPLIGSGQFNLFPLVNGLANVISTPLASQMALIISSDPSLALQVKQIIGEHQTVCSATQDYSSFLNKLQKLAETSPQFIDWQETSLNR